jgi:hypothetical protein
VPEEQFTALREIGPAAPVNTDWFTATSRVAAMGTAVSAQFGLDRPVVPAVLAALPAAGLATVVAAVDAFAPSLVVPGERLTPPPVAAVDPEAVRGVVLSGLEPTAQFDRMLEWIVVLDPDQPRARRRDPSHPVMAAPRLPDPVVDRLRELDPGWVLGGVQKLPPNSISLMRSNPQFVEAVLAGANHEFARELVWRGYPTDSMGTSLARFWPTPRQADGTLPDDVRPMAEWGDRLGRNWADGPVEGQGEVTIVVVRGDLLRRYPETVVSAVLGRRTEHGEEVGFEPAPGVEPIRELFRGALPPDVTYVGLAVDPDDLRRTVDGQEWFLALTQPVEGPRFGLDDELRGTTGQRSDTDLDDLSWQQMERLVHNGFLVQHDLPDGTWPPGFVWGRTGDAGHVACQLLQLPFQLLLPAADYL